MPHTIRQYAVREKRARSRGEKGDPTTFSQADASGEGKAASVGSSLSARNTSDAGGDVARSTGDAGGDGARSTSDAGGDGARSKGDAGATRAVERPFARKVYPLLYEIDVLS